MFSLAGLDHDPPTYASHVVETWLCVTMLGVLWRWDFSSFLPCLASKDDPLDLCLSSSWDYRHDLAIFWILSASQRFVC
jgi:hypothetical protein